MDDATAALASHDRFTSAIANTTLSIQFSVSDTPEGPVSYHVDVADGSATMARGAADAPDVTITHTYDTAVSISKGELNTQMAFMTGKLKVDGNMAKLMMNQAMLTEFAEALSDLTVEY